MNAHMQRADALGTQQRAFLDDASHQLRTHLTTLRMQVDYALRENDPAQVRDALYWARDVVQKDHPCFVVAPVATDRLAGEQRGAGICLRAAARNVVSSSMFHIPRSVEALKACRGAM